MARRSGHFRFESGHHGDRWLEPDLLLQRPTALRPFAIALVNDVTNAGSAVRGTYEDLVACGARPVAFGTLIALGAWSTSFAAEHGLALEALERLGNNLWTPEACPLCSAGEPLQDLSG